MYRSASALLGAVALLAASGCTSSSGVDEVVVAAAETVIAVGVPEGFTVGTSPTNGSVVRDVAGVPVDFTGALTMKRHARILFLAPGVPEDGFREYCQAQLSYLSDLSAVLNSPLTPQLSIEECTSSLEGASANAGSDAEVLWTSTGALDDVVVDASLVAIPSPEGARDALAIDLTSPS